jgi:chromosome segregation protein
VFLKSITLKGFKSFPDRTRLDFAPGVSVIVGPNGSGKSNVTDAVLWALGEQSPLAVRGQSMQDVIFGGAPGRQAARSAEVELVLDDSDGELNLGVPEISIVRRLDRTGEGEYRLAGARCRLVDVIELLSDTGLGKEMHSVISQGRVEAIVTSKPRDRRLLIEEAAGLGKHRKRRRRAHLKLERTQENLDRALDVEREARSSLKPLKRQAEAAELHERLERQVTETRWELARDELRAQRLTLTEAEAAAASARSRRKEVEDQLQAVARRREAAEEALSARSAHREELSRRSFTAQSASERVAYRAESARGQARSIAERAGRAAEVLSRLEAEAEAEAPDLESGARIAALEQELAALDRDREAELARQLVELERERALAEAEVQRRERVVAEALTAREAAEQGSEGARSALRAAEREVEAARRAAAKVGGQLAAVNQFLRSHASTPGGSSALSEELAVEPGYELAVAAALDGRLRAAVVTGRDAAGVLLDRAGAEGGRVLIAEGDPGGESDRGGPRPRPGAGPGPGAAELLADRLRGPAHVLALARTLLGDTWVVESLEELDLDFDGVAVTRSGRVWSPRSRELRQAPAVGEDRVLAERNRRDELVRHSEAAVQSEVAANAALERAAAAVATVDDGREEALAAHRATVRDRDEAAEEARRLGRLIEVRRTAPDDGPDGARRAGLRSELASERRMAEHAERQRGERERRIARVRLEIAREQELTPMIAALITALDAASEAIAEQRTRFEAELAADREAGEHVAAELRACAQEEAGLHTRLSAENEVLTSAEVRAQHVRDRAADAETELRALASRLELEPTPAETPLAEQERLQLSTRLERLARRREQLGPVNPLAQEQYAEALAHVEELEHQRTDLEQALRELQKLISDTDRQIRETFEETFAAAASNFEELATQLFPGGRGRLRLASEREGPARVLGGQESSADTEEEEEAAGDAAPGEQDELEDLLGVEIEITPAGKSMKRLSLLSGGEKSMTALAFLFSVFLARPCPFYILDEVEAALDDLNISRFLNLLARYSSRAQFIVVTHQKRTMEAADSLYGVSMGSDGLSKVVSRHLPRETEAA